MTEEGWPLQDVGEVGNGAFVGWGRWSSLSRVLASGSSLEGVHAI